MKRFKDTDWSFVGLMITAFVLLGSSSVVQIFFIFVVYKHYFYYLCTPNGKRASHHVTLNNITPIINPLNY